MIVKKGGCAKLIIQIYNVNFVDSNYFKGNVTIVGRFVNENIKLSDNFALYKSKVASICRLCNWLYMEHFFSFFSEFQ